MPFAAERQTVRPLSNMAEQQPKRTPWHVAYQKVEPYVVKIITPQASGIQKLLDAGRPVASFPIREYWLDIGQHADYEKAQEHIKDWKSR